MSSGFAKLFANGRSQAVRIPHAFRFSGTVVRVRRCGRGILLEPVISNPADWFAAMDEQADDTFMRNRRSPLPNPDSAGFD